jgi:hypothetical protein
MELMRLEDAKALLQHQADKCLTFIFSTNKAGSETLQNQIRFKNMYRRAMAQLEQHGMGKTKLESFLEPASRLLDDTIFWQNQAESFAMFLSPQVFKIFSLPTRLGEAMVINKRFYLKSILPFFFESGRFYILAISQKEVRLIQAAHDGTREVNVPGMPENIDEITRLYTDERHVEWHTLTYAQGTRGRAWFHGHGGPVLNVDDKILQFFYDVNKRVHNILQREHVPLVFAGVEYLLPFYREANTYPHLLEAGVHGNPDRISDDQLRRAAIEIVEPYTKQLRQDALAKYAEFAGTGHTSGNPQEVIQAAMEGRIESLFVAKGAIVYGMTDPESNTVNIHESKQPDSDDLTDLAISETFMTGGRIFEFSRETMPQHADIAAIFRYSVERSPDHFERKTY